MADYYDGLLKICGFEDGAVVLSNELKFKMEDIAEVRLEPTDDIS